MRATTKFRAAIITIALTVLVPPHAACAQDVVVFAAASLTNALDEAAQLFERQGGAHAKISYAASSALAKQIENGAPADLFISADLDWMDYLERRHLIRTSTRENLLGNRLVLVAPTDSGSTVEIKPGVDLAGLLGGGRLAMADPDTVPSGKYGKAALTYLGVWDAVAPRVAQAENVRAALVFVARGETPLGIVYATDARSEPAVKVVGTFPEESHPKIVYPVALTASAKPEARKFLEFLLSSEAAPSFEAQGFSIEGKAG